MAQCLLWIHEGEQSSSMERMMIKGLYRSGKAQQRLHTIEEIATLCRVAPQKVETWLALHGDVSDSLGKGLVGFGEIVSFLIHHNMPIPVSLLPPQSGKVMFIVTDNDDLQPEEPIFNRICDAFNSFRESVLVDTSVLSRSTPLSLLTFVPDVMVILRPSLRASEYLSGIADLMTSLPACKVIVVAKDHGRDGGTDPARMFPAALFIEDDLSDERLTNKLRQFLKD